MNLSWCALLSSVLDPVGFRHKRPDLDPTCQDRTLIIQKYLAIFKDTKKTVARVYYQIPICAALKLETEAGMVDD